MLPPVFVEPLATEHITVAIADLPHRLKGTLVAQLSDFHFDGRSLSIKTLEAAIAQCNAVNPDLVVLTGDFVTDQAQDIHELVPYLKQLESQNGIYAIFGNHDHRRRNTFVTVRDSLQSIGVHPLWNEVAYPFGEGLAVVGLADYYSKAFKPQNVLSPLDRHVPRLVLSHNPDSLIALQQYRVDLVLAGHTHGGQVTIPGWGTIPGILQTWSAAVPAWARPLIPFLKQDCDRVFHNWQWASGLHQIGSNQLYVNRGLGSYFPGRLFCPPELTVIRLVPSGSEGEP